jgi:hypothetical protein
VEKTLTNDFQVATLHFCAEQLRAQFSVHGCCPMQAALPTPCGKHQHDSHHQTAHTESHANGGALAKTVATVGRRRATELPWRAITTC